MKLRGNQANSIKYSQKPLAAFPLNLACAYGTPLLANSSRKERKGAEEKLVLAGILEIVELMRLRR